MAAVDVNDFESTEATALPLSLPQGPTDAAVQAPQRSLEPVLPPRPPPALFSGGGVGAATIDSGEGPSREAELWHESTDHAPTERATSCSDDEPDSDAGVAYPDLCRSN